jgi:hypothetical protein
MLSPEENTYELQKVGSPKKALNLQKGYTFNNCLYSITTGYLLPYIKNVSKLHDDGL